MMNLKQRMASIKDVWTKLSFILDKRQKTLGLLVLVITVINAFFQMLGISIIVPLVASITNPELIINNKYGRAFFSTFKIEDMKVFFVVLCIVTVFIYLIKEFICILQLWLGTKYSFMIQREIALKILRKYLGRTYDFFLNYGTAQIIRDVQNDSYGVNCVIAALFSMLTELLTMLLIVVYIILMDWRMAICITVLAYFCVLIIYKFFRNKMRKAGEESRELAAVSQKILLESVEGIKEVQVMCRQNFFMNEFRKAYTQEQRPRVTQRMVSESPTFLIEGLFIVFIMSFIAIRMVIDPDYASKMPILASFMVGAIRMLPSLGRISSRLSGLPFDLPALSSVYNNIMASESEASKNDILNLYDDGKVIEFTDKLELKNVSWTYKDAERSVLNNLNLFIHKGQSIGIIGQSGTGKSTLADIILGLHIPQKGSVRIDGVDIKQYPFAYSRVIGYVPQTVYLIDGTIRENVAFGVLEKDIDDKLVWESLKRAKLDRFVNESENGLNTVIGERGVRFSGGQRQRLAIARALYRKPQILVLDEATSALDTETESAVMEAIENLYGSITMIIIAHRITTVKHCDVIYEVREGTVFEVDKKKLF